MNNPFRKFFEPEDDSDVTALGECHEVVSFANHPYFKKGLMAYLERGCDEKLVITDNISVIRSAERVNTFKEIKTHLNRQIRDAMAVIERETIDA